MAFFKYIRVENTTENFGTYVFWEGTEDRIHEIRSVPARKIAEEVAKDGQTRESGMWMVSVIGGKNVL